MENRRKESGLGAMDNIALKIKERNERIWKNEEHNKYVFKNIDQLNNEIKQMEEEIKEMDDDNERNETYVKQIRATTELMKGTLESTNDSVGYMSDLKRLVREQNKSINSRFTEGLAACRETFSEYKTRLESTSALYKNVQVLTVKMKLYSIQVLDLKQKLADQNKMNEQRRKIQKDVWNKGIVKFAKACLGYQKASELFHRLKIAESDERQLIKNVLAMQRKVKEKKATYRRRSTNKSPVPTIDFTTYFCNSEKRESHIPQENLVEQQLERTFKSSTRNFSDTINFAITDSGNCEKYAVNQFESDGKQIKLNPTSNKVRILNVVQSDATNGNLVKFGNHYVSKKILRAAQKRQTIRRKSSALSLHSSSQWSREGTHHSKQAPLSQGENLSQSSVVSGEMLLPMEQNDNCKSTEHDANDQSVNFSQDNIETASIKQQVISKDANKLLTQHNAEHGETFSQNELPTHQNEYDKMIQNMNEGTSVTENEKCSDDQNTCYPGDYNSSQQLPQGSHIENNDNGNSYMRKSSQRQEIGIASTLQGSSQVILDQEIKKATVSSRNETNVTANAFTSPNNYAEFQKSNDTFLVPKPVEHLPIKRSYTGNMFGSNAADADTTKVGSISFFKPKINFPSFFNINKNNQSEHQDTNKENSLFSTNIPAQDNTQLLFTGAESSLCDFGHGIGLDTSGDLNMSFLRDIPQSPPIYISSLDGENRKQQQDAPLFGQNILRTENAPESKQFSFGTSTSFFNLFSSK